MGIFGHDEVDVFIAGEFEPEFDLLRIASSHGLCVQPTPRSWFALLLSRSHIALGDPFGKAAILTLLSTVVKEVVFLEDGLSSIAAISQLSKGDSLLRPRDGEVSGFRERIKPLIGFNYRRLASLNKVSWVMCSASSLVLEKAGVTVIGRRRVHKFGTLKSMCSAGVNRGQSSNVRIVVGSSYATNGLMRTEAYNKWLVKMCSESSCRVVFVPHPRELSASKTIVLNCGASVSVDRKSVERVVLESQEVDSIHCLPSSPILSLATLGYGEKIGLTKVNGNDWCPDAPCAFRELVSLVEDLQGVLGTESSGPRTIL